MTSDTNELRKQVNTLLKTVASSVYYLNFPKPASYPYVVFDLRDMGESEGQTRFMLDIDAVHTDVYALQSMADSIQDAIDHRTVSTSKLFFHVYRSGRYSVVEDDKSIHRIHINAELFHYSKED